MSFNTAPSAYPTPMLVCDPFQEPNGSWDSVPSFTLGTNGLPVSAALEIQSLGALLNPRLSEDERDDLNVYPGMQIYNLNESVIQFYYGGAINAWVTPLAEIGSGIENDIVVFGPSAGTIQDSGVRLLLDLGNLNYYTGVLTGNANFTAANSFGQGINVINNITTANRVYASGIGVLDQLTEGNRNTGIGINCAINLVDSDDNFFAGINVFTSAASGSQNVLIGNNVLATLSDADANDGNVCIGYNVGATVTAGNDNVLLGRSVAQSAGTVSGCTLIGQDVASAIGNAALVDLTAVGAFALQNVQTNASRLVGVGWSALQSATTATRCTAVGYQAAANVTVSATGADTTAVGHASLILATTSTQSTAVGSNTATSQTQYTDCTFIGYGADATQNNLTNASAIGANAEVGASNSMILGAPGTQVGINTPTPVANFHNNGSDALGYRILEDSDLPATPPYPLASPTDNVIICYPEHGNRIVNIPTSGPTNQGLTYKFVNLGSGGGNNITVQALDPTQPIDTNNTLGPSYNKTFIAIYSPLKTPQYRWAVLGVGNDS